jgi:hypothetical protein
MSLTKVLFCASLIGILTFTSLSQSRVAKEPDCPQENREIERKDDRFTNEATFRLKPQPITVTALGQQLKIALEYKAKPKERGRAETFIPKMVDVVFTSVSASRIYEREAELVFLIDGERVRRVPGAVHDDYSRLSTEKILTQTIFTGMSVETLRRMRRAKTVEMKLGDAAMKLNSEVLSAIRAFAECALANN